MKLSKRFHEMWGLTIEGGEERTYSIVKEVAQLEAKVSAIRAFNIQSEASSLTLGEAIVELQSQNHKLARENERLRHILDAIRTMTKKNMQGMKRNKPSEVSDE